LKGSIPLKSTFVNVIGGILRRIGMDTTLIVCTALKCFFRAEADDPSPANPPAIVLITPLTRVFGSEGCDGAGPSARAPSSTLLLWSPRDSLGSGDRTLLPIRG